MLSMKADKARLKKEYVLNGIKNAMLEISSAKKRGKKLSTLHDFLLKLK